MSCAIDHSIEGTFPAFLCRGCNPDQFKAGSGPLSVAVVTSTPADDFRNRYPLTDKDRETIAELAAIEEAVTKARSYQRIEALRNRVVEKIAERKAAVPDQPLDLDELKQVVVHKRPGIIATLMEMMRRKEGASRAEMLAELVRLHPDRDPKGMGGTINKQSRLLSTSSREDNKRGMVFYMVVEE